jgi:lycopene cyclase domain-containing protein
VKLGEAFSAIIIVMIPYIFWDSMVTHSHWWFNEKFTLEIRIFNLPIGELLFFISVPFACLLIWETIKHKILDRVFIRKMGIYFFLYMLVPVGIFLFVMGKEYTGLVLTAIGLSAFLDYLLETNLFTKRNTYIFLGVLTGLILIFNGYLTARPVVLYGIEYQIGFRIITIPIEDFGYGYSLMLFCIIIYEKFLGVKFV